VRDSGPGVPQEIRTRIFDPFYTTKPEGQGTGLGLALSRRLVEGMGGQLQLAESRTGGLFIVRLPLASVDTRAEGAGASNKAAIDPMEGVGT
jgi:two-component system NtrC family sensor kinase